jgi:hypothetical protein
MQLKDETGVYVYSGAFYGEWELKTYCSIFKLSVTKVCHFLNLKPTDDSSELSIGDTKFLSINFLTKN